MRVKVLPAVILGPVLLLVGDRSATARGVPSPVSVAPAFSELQVASKAVAAPRAAPTKRTGVTAPPTVPPDASRITVGAADADGYATVAGADGSVPSEAEVLVVNLSSRNVNRATATAGGAFSLSLFAPPGSTLLVKYDLDVTRIDQFWLEAVLGGANTISSVINPLPGTTVHVGSVTPGAGEFESVGSFDYGESAQWAGWWVDGTLAGPAGPGALDLQPGDSLTVDAVVRVTSPLFDCAAAPSFTLTTETHLRYLFADDGRAHPWTTNFAAHLFTPTGLPIEHEANGERRQVDTGEVVAFTCVSAHTAQGTITRSFTVPVDLPEGVYRPEITFEDGGAITRATPPSAVVWYHLEPVAAMPQVTLGAPAPPRIPWVLLSDALSNGHRGVMSREDAGRYSMLTRVVLPHRTTVLPRLDERTGEVLSYRLEPGSPWLSSTDRRMPNPPLIPLRLPAGQLTVQLTKPDGTSELLGPAPILQSFLRTPTTAEGYPIDDGTGHVGDVFHLYTGDSALAYQFDQYGVHTVVLNGSVTDVFGTTYQIAGTYDVLIARILDLDPGQLPTTPYQQGDAVSPNLHVFPPVPAQVAIELVHMPFSDPSQATTRIVTGTANRFGYFQPPPGTEIRLPSPGEYRVDVSASYLAPDGTLWAGSMTWGSVVAGVNSLIEAHGRRGLDFETGPIDDTPTWFVVSDLPPAKLGKEMYYPYFRSDLHWGDETAGVTPGESIHNIISLEDLSGPDETIYDIIRSHFPRATNCYRWPPAGCTAAGLEERIAIGEAPLFITTASGIDPEVSPTEIDLWGYSYSSSERPDVRVREVIAEDLVGTAYWRFQDTYGYQIGESADGDQPGDLKWEFGGIVFRRLVDPDPVTEYAIYGSLWVLLPHNDPVGARVAPPFQDATGASFNGGPILTLLGEDVDMLFLPKGVRPGDVLEVGDTISFCGHVGPPLDSRVSVTITAPSGASRSGIWYANRAGWLYDPTFDFVAEEAGRWTVAVDVLHDRPYVGNGVTPQSHNTGTVLGTTGQYDFYVVAPQSPRLEISAPTPGIIVWPNNQVEPIDIVGVAPAGTTAVFYTIHDKGVVMGRGSVTPDATGAFTLTYDAVTLHGSFPMLSLTAREGIREGLSDEVAINLLATGAELRANTVTLISEEAFVGADPEDSGLIFADGFESGNTSAWSSTRP